MQIACSAVAHAHAKKTPVGTKNNNMLMNYKSAKIHAYVLHSKFLRKLCFAKTCIIRAVKRNNAASYPFGNISCFNHKRFE